MTQVTETTNDGLKRELQVVIDRTDIDSQFNARLDELQGQAQIKGFRKGKVPKSYLKKLYGQSLMAEVLQKAVELSSSEALSERKERPALQPKIDLPEDKAEIEKVMAGEADLSFKMSFEVIPEIKIADFSDIAINKLVVKVGDKELDKAMGELAERATDFETVEGRVVETGDRVKIDYAGQIDDEPFDGGTGEGMDVVIGQGGFIPGFEDGLLGAKAGDERVIETTFPEAYQAKDLAGKDAKFDVTVVEVAKAVVPPIDDELAKKLGAESLDKLRELITMQMSDEYVQVSRNKMKRDLLDALEKAHGFELPPTLVEAEFDAVWQQMTQSMTEAGKTFEDENKTEDEARKEFHEVAERRVRLGLVLGEIGEKNEIKVTKEELQRAVMEQARRYQGQEKFVFEYYEKNPGALNELRAPIYEDKVVDFVLELAKVEEKAVSIEELLKTMDADADDEDGETAS